MRFIIVGFLFFLLSCSEEPLKPKTGSNPEIISISMPDRWNLNSADSAIVEITVSDPQGFADLDSAIMRVFNTASEQVFSAQLYDDGGSSGSTDVLAFDGVFRNIFMGSDISSEAGDFRFTFNISDKTGNAADELSKTIIFGFNTAPQIIASPAINILESGAQPQVISVIAKDEDNSPGDVNVFMDLLLDNTSIFNEPIQMANDGNIAVNGDVFASDTIYSLIIDSTFAAGKQGNYTMVFTARDEFDDQSDSVTNEILIENDAPLISRLSAPDTLNAPSGQQLTTALITLDVNDSQGLADIDSVYFISIKPDSSPASGNPFIMLDNGIAFDITNFDVARGDQIAADGTFSITIILNSSNDLGLYEFTFWARDKVGHLSNSISHFVEVQ